MRGCDDPVPRAKFKVENKEKVGPGFEDILGGGDILR
jgi:hypothetical protein